MQVQLLITGLRVERPFGHEGRPNSQCVSLQPSETRGFVPQIWETLASLGFNIPRTHQSTLDCFLVNPRLSSRQSWPALNEHPQNQNNIQFPATTLIVDDSSADEDDDAIMIIKPSSSTWARRCDVKPNELDE